MTCSVGEKVQIFVVLPHSSHFPCFCPNSGHFLCSCNQGFFVFAFVNWQLSSSIILQVGNPQGLCRVISVSLYPFVSSMPNPTNALPQRKQLSSSEERKIEEGRSSNRSTLHIHKQTLLCLQ